MRGARKIASGLTISRRRALELGTAGAAVMMTGLGGLSSVAHAADTPSLEHFKDALPAPRTFKPRPNGRYVVDMRQLRHQIHSDIGQITRVWGYGDRDGVSFPGPTFDVRSGQTTTVKWRNRLSRNQDARHYLRQRSNVWSSIHGAVDNRKAVVHLHGGHITADVDGYPYDTFLPGEDRLYRYKIDQNAATLWYHDHALGNTRLNVMMGLAGFFLVRDDEEDALVSAKKIPGPDHEMPLVFMDRRIKEDGRLGYDKAFDDSFFGDVSLTNGVAWPHMYVEPRKYRFRMLNGANSRIYTLKLADGSLSMHQIGTDGGLMAAPVELNELTLSPGERRGRGHRLRPGRHQRR